MINEHADKISSIITTVFILAVFMILTIKLSDYNVVKAEVNNNNVTQDSSVKLDVDIYAKTATISNKFITIKCENNGRVSSLIKDGKELIGTAKGFSCDADAKKKFTVSSLKVITNTPEMADIAYLGDWGELHYVLRSDTSGVYSYFITGNNGLKDIGEFRTLYRLDGSIFTNGYNAIKKGPFPTLDEIKSGTELQNETWRLPDGQPYTKYDWADYEWRDHVHGIYGNGYGAWLIPVSNEYYNGGPMRQELMVHIESATGDGVLLNMLKGSHYGAGNITYNDGKIFGPWLVYFNDGDSKDAEQVAAKEEAKWPYKWLNNPSYPLSRTTVSGKLEIPDGRSTAGATVVLTKPGGDFYRQGTDYIFYTKADSKGMFNIPNVRPGDYTLYAYTTSGDIADEFRKDYITVNSDAMNLGTLEWNPPKYTNFLWKIGNADRKASEFKFGDLQRQYGIPEKVPENLTYNIGTSSEAKDWYYAQTKVGSFDINFNLDKEYNKDAHLTVPVASAARNPMVEIYVNGQKVNTLDYSKDTENDGTTYRSTLESGHYRMNEINFPASLLKKGNNTISFKMVKVSKDGGIMYDMIKLETD